MDIAVGASHVASVALTEEAALDLALRLIGAVNALRRPPGTLSCAGRRHPEPRGEDGSGRLRGRPFGVHAVGPWPNPRSAARRHPSGADRPGLCVAPRG
jgi:hypothetical protein